jgi:hypothetical protein
MVCAAAVSVAEVAIDQGGKFNIMKGLPDGDAF